MNYVQFFQLQDGIISIKKSTVIKCISLCNLGFQLDPNLSQTELTNVLLYQSHHYSGHAVEIVDYWTAEDVLHKLHMKDEKDVKLSPLGRILHNCLTADKTYINKEVNLLQNGPIKQFTRLLYPFCLINNNDKNNTEQLMHNYFVGLLHGSTKNIKDTHLCVPKNQAIFIYHTRPIKRTNTNVFLVIAPYRESTIDPIINKLNEKSTLYEETITVVEDEDCKTYSQAYSGTFVFTDENATSIWVMQNTIERCFYYTPAFPLSLKSYREIAVIKLGHIPSNTPPPRIIHHNNTNSQYFWFDNFIFKPEKWSYQTFAYDNTSTVPCEEKNSEDIYQKETSTTPHTEETQEEEDKSVEEEA